MKSRNGRAWALALGTWLVSSELFACGPEFPNTLLDQGDAALLGAPMADFCGELERIKLAELNFKAVPDTGASEMAEADLDDLRAALKKARVLTDKREQILAAYKLARFGSDPSEEAKSAAQAQDESGQVNGVADAPSKATSDPPEKGVALPVEDLPGEFADYLGGATAWHAGQVEAARTAWEILLARPESERRYRSTWAAYMLGRYWHNADPEKASEYYRQVRTLAQQGFADSLGLAASSLGWEAQIHFLRNEYEPALKLYLQQHASGDPTACASIRLVANAAAKASPEGLQRFASQPLARRVLTAYAISTRPCWTGEDDPQDFTTAWLEAAERADVKDMESAEQLALAAYQAARFDLAQRWLKRTRATPIAQWLQGKLLLRAGKVEQAAALYRRLAQEFPLETGATHPPAGLSLKDSLFMSGHDAQRLRVRAATQVHGELGVLHLARREYIEALDTLVRAGFWMDGAYVAERVLTVDELKSYVDRNWPPVSSPAEARLDEGEDLEASRTDVRKELRYLLARRFTRLHRGYEARPYYPPEWLLDFDALVAALQQGWNESLPAGQRAKALFEAARIARHKGLELLGTELEPDWHVHGGDFEAGPTYSRRATNEAAHYLVASEDELRRAGEQRADPEARFHYRYQAAFLGLEAANLMPDNSDETAFVLCTAGSWIKVRDPQVADIFYKALVRRCPMTALGAEADRMRWFPALDENGNILPRKEPQPAEPPPAEMDELPIEEQL